jgi:hypothetical protein
MTSKAQPPPGKVKKEIERKKEKKILEEEIKRIEREKEEEEYDKWKLKEDEFLKRQLIEQYARLDSDRRFV